MAKTSDDPIAMYFRTIARADPDKLGGVRTTPEVAALFNLKRDTARHRLEKLANLGEVECLGILKCERGKPVGWKTA